MAKTVAEIDGDSSGLVSELGKAKTAMGDLESGGKKLTDQLKDVADKADIAAGNLVQKLGGPSAIQAIGGIGIAFTGAKAVVGAFLDSSEKLFRSYGEQGQKTWEKLEQQMDGISGAFAKAALGGGDMNQQAERMSQLLGTVSAAADASLSPLAAVGDAFFDIAYWESEATKEAKKFAAETKKAEDAKVAAERQAATEKEHYKQLLQEAATAAGKGALVEQGKQLEKAIEFDKAALVTRQSLATKYEYFIRDSYKNTAGMNAEQIALQGRRAQEEVDNMKKVVVEGKGNLTAILKKYGDEQVANELAILKVGAQNLRDAVGAELSVRQQQQEALEKFGTQTPTRTNSIGKSKVSAAEEDPKAKAEREAKELADLKYANDQREQQMELDRLKRIDDNINAETERKKAAIDAVNQYALEQEQAMIDAIHARGELTKDEQKQLDEERIAAVKERTGQELSLYMQTAGKQFAIGQLSAKQAAEMARKQLGNVIMGLGDKAMAEAGIMAAALNPLAVPMAAAGVAAYAIGGALSADKKPTGSTPSTEKAESAAPPTTNYAYNLRIDSVFADGESVARQFAMMQESARQRGLLMQGA